MKDYRIIKGKRIHINQLAADSRRNTVKNCTIPKIDETQLKKEAEWTIPKEGFPQYKSLRKKYKKKYRFKDGSIRKIISHSSDYDAFSNPTFRPNKGRAWYMEQVTQHKIAKWERKNPCPVKEDQNPPDIFEQEYVVPWKAEREKALERIRDFVVSMYDKLPLKGRFQESDTVYKEETIAELKDYNGDGHKINEIDPKKSRLLRNAQKITNKVHSKRRNLICTNLKDHKRIRGRILIPKAA